MPWERFLFLTQRCRGAEDAEKVLFAEAKSLRSPRLCASALKSKTPGHRSGSGNTRIVEMRGFPPAGRTRPAVTGAAIHRHTMTKSRILVVDDEPNLSGLVRLFLEKTQRFEVRVENRSALALAAAREFRPDLILLDVDMPGKNGGDVAREIQAEPALRGVGRRRRSPMGAPSRWSWIWRNCRPSPAMRWSCARWRRISFSTPWMQCPPAGRSRSAAARSTGRRCWRFPTPARGCARRCATAAWSRSFRP